MADKKLIDMDLSVIIVNYNTEDHLRDCLNSINQFSHKILLEVIVVDNNSPDREIELFPSEFPEIKFIFSHTNDGFGAGCNKGASEAKGKYIAFVNPDIVFESDCLSELFSFMEKNPDVGACSPLLKDFEGNLTYIYNNFPNYNWEFYEASGFGNEKKISDLLEIFNNSDKAAVEVDWVTGACLFLRSEIFTKLKGYDEDYFLYYEDTDLQYRIHESGYRIMCLAEYEVKHFTNSTIRSDKGEDIYFFHINRSKLIYMYKHFNIIKRNIIRMFHIAGILIRLLTLPFRKKFENKKEKRFRQYQRMLKLYLSGFNSILESNYRIS